MRFQNRQTSHQVRHRDVGERIRLIHTATSISNGSAELRDSEFDDLDKIAHPLAVAILVFFQGRRTEGGISERRNVIFVHCLGAQSPNPVKEQPV